MSYKICMLQIIQILHVKRAQARPRAQIPSEKSYLVRADQTTYHSDPKYQDSLYINTQSNGPYTSVESSTWYQGCMCSEM